MSVREPAVAGMFYPAGAVELKRQIEACFLDPGGPGSLPEVTQDGPGRITGLVSPHAGYVYSGSVAAWAYHDLAQDGLPDTVVLIGPSHRSYYPEVALSDDIAWRTPMGDVALDAGVTAEIASAYPQAEVESQAHYGEHSLEVQAPFLQYIYGMAGRDVRIAPVLIGGSAGSRSEGGRVEVAHELGSAVARALGGKNAVIIASTDFTHYESAESARIKDSHAISCILSLDEDCLIQTVESLGITMCGMLPTAVMITACKKMGAKSARQLAYRNSGDVTGDYSEVVAYGSFEILK